MAKIVIIDDEPAMVEVIVTLCREKGHQVFPFNSAPKAVEQLDTLQPHVVIADIRMETMTGFDVLRHVREHHRQTAVILITAYASVETAVEAMKMGAYDYVTKPFKIDELQRTTPPWLDYQAALRENTYLRKELTNKYRFENIIGTSRSMQQVYNVINKVADTDSTVLIQGESGTGKELVARALHFNSNRQHHPFVAINCSALPENLLESELFGHKKGAFTGAATGGAARKSDPQALESLSHCDYAGNVRELENAIERACALCDDDLILESDLPPQIVAYARGEQADKVRASMPVGEPLDDYLREQERRYIEATLEHFGGSRETAAKVLGISMATLYRKVEAKGKTAAAAAK